VAGSGRYGISQLESGQKKAGLELAVGERFAPLSLPYPREWRRSIYQGYESLGRRLAEAEENERRPARNS
jgi:hypothetical protein